MERRALLKGMGKVGLGVAAGSAVGFAPIPALAQGTEISLAAAGDCLITRKFPRDEPGVQSLVEILRGGDVCFGNMEMTLPDAGMHPAPTGRCGDLNNSAEGPIAEELRWAGFDIMSAANNHALDYGAEGMFATSGKLNAAGIFTAGTGATLAEASAPAFCDTSRGRVALIACASTIRAWSLAADGNDEIPGRPGLNPLRFETTYQVDAKQLETLKQIAETLFPGRRGLVPQAQQEGVNLLGNQFIAGSRPDILTAPNPVDLKRIVTSVRRAARNADLVLVSIHAHEGDRSRDVAAKFLPIFAHACIDAGADAFLAHGPHVLRGIEVYKKRPIFYSLGNFMFEAESMRQIPQEIYDACSLSGNDPSDFFDRAMQGFSAGPFWESVVARANFRNHELVGLRLHPISLRPELSRARRGTPVLASPEKGKAILESLVKLSEPYATRITVSGGIGNVEV